MRWASPFSSVKFKARETGSISNYVLHKRYLSTSRVWLAQQEEDAVTHGDDGENEGERAMTSAADNLRPMEESEVQYLETEDLEADADDAESTMAPGRDDSVQSHTGLGSLRGLLAYPPLPDDRVGVMLHSRVDITRQRIINLLRLSKNHITIRQGMVDRVVSSFW